MPATRRRVTQQDIAKMTGVSQATVSLVLNGRDDAEVRIAPETRERVLHAIHTTGYVADPIARRLAAGHNRILGVFTYESVFPAGLGDFYHPFLVGIEECAERIGCDLLLFTSAPVVDGRRRIFHRDNRLRLADGCILLGRALERSELARLVAEEQPFVSVGRRDDAGGPVPYVGADYPGATAAQVRRAVELGHTRIAYVGEGAGPESHADRMRGFTAAVTAAGVDGRHLTIAGYYGAETGALYYHGEHLRHRPQADDTLLVGRESSGVPAEVAAAADARLVIPMQPGLRSLNVAMAAAIVAGEAIRQLQAPARRAAS